VAAIPVRYRRHFVFWVLGLVGPGLSILTLPAQAAIVGGHGPVFHQTEALFWARPSTGVKIPNAAARSSALRAASNSALLGLIGLAGVAEGAVDADARIGGEDVRKPFEQDPDFFPSHDVQSIGAEKCIEAAARPCALDVKGQGGGVLGKCASSSHIRMPGR
jgi:hypothetical protein